MQLINPVFIKPKADKVFLDGRDGNQITVYNFPVGLHLIRSMYVCTAELALRHEHCVDGFDNCFTLAFMDLSACTQYWYYNTEDDAQKEYNRILEEY